MLSNDFIKSVNINVSNSRNAGWWFDKNSYGVSKNNLVSDFIIKILIPELIFI